MRYILPVVVAAGPTDCGSLNMCSEARRTSHGVFGDPSAHRSFHFSGLVGKRKTRFLLIFRPLQKDYSIYEIFQTKRFGPSTSDRHSAHPMNLKNTIFWRSDGNVNHSTWHPVYSNMNTIRRIWTKTKNLTKKNKKVSGLADLASCLPFIILILMFTCGL